MPARIVLGLDPGSRVTGYGVVAESSGVLTLIAAGTVRTKPKDELAARLGVIYARLAELIEAHGPHEVAVEDVFTAANASSALKLGQARGAALAACACAGLGVHSYPPTVVKKSLTGQGRADKAQVAFMIARLLNHKAKLAADATDALAVAVCHLNQRRMNKLAGS